MAIHIKRRHQRPGLVVSGNFSENTATGRFNQQLAQAFHHTQNYALGIFADEINALPLSLSAYANHLPSQIAVQIEHRAVPVLIPPDQGHWIIAQPWEYGALPVDWLETLQHEADDVWVHNPHNLQHFLQAGISPERVFLIPPGVDTEVFQPEGNHFSLPAKHADTCCFLFEGQTLWYSGLDILLKAFQAEFLDDEKVSLVCLCPPESGEAFQELLTQLEQAIAHEALPITLIHQNLSREERAALYRRCQYLVYPCRGEGVGAHLWEAAACGLPLILSALPGHFGIPDAAPVQWLTGRDLKQHEARIAGMTTQVPPFWYEVSSEELRFALRQGLEQPQDRALSFALEIQKHYTWAQRFTSLHKRVTQVIAQPVHRLSQSNLQKETLNALQAIEKKNWSQALKHFETVLREKPDDALVVSHLASVYIERGEYAKALAQLLPLLQAGESRANIYHLTGVALFHLKAWSLAQAFFSQVLIQQPDHPGALASLPLSQEKAHQPGDQSAHYLIYEQCLSKPSSQRTATLTLCMIVKNESLFLRQCLESVQGLVDQIVVVDTGSNDDTPDIAREMGAEVYDFAWTGSFAEARNYSLMQARCDWILILDADEVFAPESRMNLMALINQAHINVTLYLPKIRNLSERDNHVDIVEHYMVRLFPNHPDICFTGDIHEQIQIKNPELSTEKLMAPDLLLLHYGYTGEVMDSKDKYTRNLALLKETINTDPDNPFHWFNLGLTYSNNQEKEEALAAFQKAVSLSQNLETLPPYMAACHNYILSVLTQLDRYEEARQHAHNAPDLCQESPDYWLNYGVLWNALEDPEKALMAFKKALDMRRKSYQAVVSDHSSTTWKPLAGMGNTYLLLGELSQADHYFRRAVKENPHQPSILVGLLQLAVYRKDIPKAEAYLEALNPLQDKLDSAALAQVALEKARLELLKGGSIEHSLSQLLASGADPKIETQARVELALLKARQNKFSEAQEVLTPLLDQPTQVESSLRLFYQGGAFEELLALLKGIVKTKDMPTAQDYANLGAVYLQLKQEKEARTYFEQALQLNPEQADALHNLGVIALQQDQLETASTYFQRALSADPTSFESHLDLAKIALHQTQWSLADHHLAQAHTLQPKHIEVMALQAWSAEQNGDLDLASQRYLDILEEDPYHQDSLIQLGLLLSEAGAYGEALQLFEKALDLGNTSLALYNGIGLCFLQTERYVEARNAFLLALQQAPNQPELQRAVQLADTLSGQAPLC